jgi:hypothetical protein
LVVPRALFIGIVMFGAGRCGMILHGAAEPPAAVFSQGAAAPSDAVVLFDGGDFSHWEGNEGEPLWTLHEDYMEVKPHTGSIESKERFGACQMHIEFAEPGRAGAGDGRSGVVLQGLYELPIRHNAGNKPGQWQTFDVIFEPARWNGQHELARPARLTVLQNGVLIHGQPSLPGPAGHRRVAGDGAELPATGPIQLREQGAAVRFRNIWVRRIREEEKP